MKAIDFESKNIPVLNLQSKVREAMDLMSERNVYDLPVVEQKNPLGVVSRNQLLLLPPNETIGAHFIHKPQYRIFREAHWMEVFRLFNNLEHTLIPLVDVGLEYCGSIELREFLSKLSTLEMFSTPGAILLIESGLRDFSLSEVARIAEANSVSILECHINTNQEQQKVEVSLKLNRTELKSLMATYERYGYVIKNSFMRDTSEDDYLQQRYDMLMKFLNI